MHFCIDILRLRNRFFFYDTKLLFIRCHVSLRQRKFCFFVKLILYVIIFPLILSIIQKELAIPFFLRDTSCLATLCQNISRNRKTIVYSMSYAKKVSVIIFSLIISIIQKKVGHPKDLPRYLKKPSQFTSSPPDTPF